MNSLLCIEGPFQNLSSAKDPVLLKNRVLEQMLKCEELLVVNPNYLENTQGGHLTQGMRRDIVMWMATVSTRPRHVHVADFVTMLHFVKGNALKLFFFRRFVFALMFSWRSCSVRTQIWLRLRSEAVREVLRSATATFAESLAAAISAMRPAAFASLHTFTTAPKSQSVFSRVVCGSTRAIDIQPLKLTPALYGPLTSRGFMKSALHG